MPQTLSVGAALGNLFAGQAVAAPGQGAEALGLGNLFGQVLGAGLQGGKNISPVALNGAANPQTGQIVLGASASVQISVSTIQLGATPVQLQAAAGETAGLQTQALQLITQRVTILYQHISTQGINFNANPSAAELTNALTTLGVPTEAAQGIATQFQTLLGLLEQQQSLLEAATQSAAPEAANSLGAALLASLVAALYPQLADALSGEATNGAEGALQNTAQSLNHVSFQISITHTTTQNFASTTRVAAFQGSGFSARQSLLQDFGQSAAADFIAPHNQAAVLLVQPAPSVAQLTLSVLPAVLPEGFAEAGASSPLQATLQATLQAVLPATQNAATSLASLATNAQNTNPGQAQKLEAPKALTGRVVYTLTEGTGGTNVLQVAPLAPAEPSANPTFTPRNGAAPEAQLVNNEAALLNQALETPTLPQAPLASPSFARFTSHLQQAQQHQVAGQVALAIQPLVKNGEGGGAVRLVLNPPELGRIEIHLHIAAGEVSGAIESAEPAVIEHLARELPTLKQALTEAGLKLGEQGLSLLLNQNNQQSGQEHQRQPNPFGPDERGQSNRNGSQTVGEDLAPTAPLVQASRWVAPERVLDREV